VASSRNHQLKAQKKLRLSRYVKALIDSGNKKLAWSRRGLG